MQHTIQPKKGMAFPISYQHVRKILDDDFSNYPHWGDLQVEYANPTNTSKMPLDGWAIAEISPKKKVSLFSVPTDVNSPLLIEGLRHAMHVAISKPPPAFYETAWHRDHSIVIRVIPPDKFGYFHRIVSYRQVKYRSSNKFSGQHPRIDKDVEKRI